MNDRMIMESRELSAKAARMIDSSEDIHKPCVERWLCLYNSKMHKNLDKASSVDGFSLVGMSMGIERRFKNKFGQFTIRYSPIKLELK